MALVMVADFALSSSIAQTFVVPPVDRMQPPEPPGFIGRGRTVSAAANAARAACQCLNEILIRRRVEQALREKDGVISDLLSSSGQTGVLVRINIQKLAGETPIYSIVGNDVLVVGAGTDPSAVNLAYHQRDQLEPAPNRNATIDLDKSYFIWLSKDGRDVTAEIRNARGVVSETARIYADEKILQSLNAANDVAALGVAAAHLEKNVSDRRLKQKLADLRQRQLDDEKKVKEIEENLAKELERARKAQATAATLSMVASVMTLASQIGTAVTSLGADAPTGLDKASSPGELQTMVDDLVKSSDAKAGRLRLDYKSVTDGRTGIRNEMLTILKQSRYPISSVPQIAP